MQLQTLTHQYTSSNPPRTIELRHLSQWATSTKQKKTNETNHKSYPAPAPALGTPQYPKRITGYEIPIEIKANKCNSKP